jgi:glycerol uptake facilitator-like aquaporin
MMMRHFRWRMVVVAVAAAVAGGGIGVAMASQPLMDSALRALQSAQESLGHVTLDKGGHASNARRLVAEAIVQVQEGIEYGRAHGY